MQIPTKHSSHKHHSTAAPTDHLSASALLTFQTTMLPSSLPVPKHDWPRSTIDQIALVWQIDWSSENRTFIDTHERTTIVPSSRPTIST